MPTKKKTKKKKEEIPTEKQYNLLTLEEFKLKELKYNNRLLELRKCLNFMDDAVSEVRTLNEHQLLQYKWLDFVNCNPLPKPYVPPDIRRFYRKLEYVEKENVAQSMSWLLSVDERSILSQDISRKDLTHRTLVATLREDLGDEYNNYIRASMDILQRIESFLAHDEEVSICPVNILDDVVKRKIAIENEIINFMDRFTYRIISSESSRMHSIDAVSAEYFFNASDFIVHIWCLKDVAIRLAYLSEPRKLVNFHSLKLLLHIPSNMLKENLVVRAVHQNFDHLSETAKTFKLPIPPTSENQNGSILDLYDCLVNEWSMRMEIQDKILQKMKQDRLEYDEKMREYEEQMEKNKERKKKSKKANRIVKPKYEPPAIEDDMVPDIYEEFLLEEQRQYENFLQTICKPDLFDLSSDEMNLRKYSILGGIYQLHYVEKPKQTQLNGLNMTWHKNDYKLVVDRNVQISSGSWYFQQSQVQSSRRFTIRMTVFEAENRIIDPNVDCPWFIVTIDLPEYLCHWGEPIACHFEETVERVEHIPRAENIESKYNLKDYKEQAQSKFNIQPDIAAIKSVDSLAGKDLSAQGDFYLKSKRLTDSQLTRRNTLFENSLANVLLQRRNTELLSKVGLPSIQVKDFSLLETLTKPQIRHIERHLIPRIISSYKFPIEIQFEEKQMQAKKAKGKGGIIIRPKAPDLLAQSSRRQFTATSRQNNPERIYAKYPQVQNILITSYLKGLCLLGDQKEPETFAQLLKIVEDIKKEYLLHKNKILDLEPLEKQIVTYNKRIEQMLRKKKLSSTKPTNVIRTPSIKSSFVKSLEAESITPEYSEGHDLTNLGDISPENMFQENDLLSGKRSSTMSDSQEIEEIYDVEVYSHWTRKYIFKTEFDRQNHKIVLYTDRLGNFAFAFKRYEHFPFKYWSMEPSGNDPDNEVLFTLDTQYVRCILYITANGIRGHITKPYQSYVHNPKMYLVIENPIKDFKEFQKLLKEKHLNIFAAPDTCFYIENGYYSEKHLSNEFHTYNCMSIHSTQMRFIFSTWNRLAKRRDIILKFSQYQDLAENQVEVRITPVEAYFVELEELCSNDLDVIKLDYKLTWRNIASYSDLHHLIVSMYPNATELRCKNSKLIGTIKELLSAVRPLSFS